MSACGGSHEPAASKPPAGEPAANVSVEEPTAGLLVFSGLTSGSYLHAIRPDGDGLAEVELPKTCSPDDFARDGELLRCYRSHERGYAVSHDGDGWTRVRRPPEWTFPSWIVWGQYGNPADDDAEGIGISVPRWAPAHDRIAFVRESETADGWWFTQAGDIVVADPTGIEERVVAEDGQAPAWSPDGRLLAFSRCVERGYAEDDDAEESAECSAWVVPADGSARPLKIAEGADSPPVWSPDGRFVAFFRMSKPCAVVCKSRIRIVPAQGGEGRTVGPELTLPEQLFWLPASASAVRLSPGTTAFDPLELQRCADIWNRAHMQFRRNAASISLVNGGCAVTLAYWTRSGGHPDSSFPCTQPVPFTFECPDHAHAPRWSLEPRQWIWNAVTDRRGRLTLVDPPSGPRLPLPEGPPYPLWHGYVLPFDDQGVPRAGLTYSGAVSGACGGHWWSNPDSVRCSWGDYLNNSCFKGPGPMRPGDVVLCPDGAGSTRFLRVELAKVGWP